MRGHGIAGVMAGGLACASAGLGRDLGQEVTAGAVFGDPSWLAGGDPGCDPWETGR